jgi:uncharacterized SAM-binding protein YcdF (DUF218 family)
MRLIVVLGYSGRSRGDGLHPICAARVTAAAALASGNDTVLLTGRPEAELMRRSWSGDSRRVLCDTKSRVTAESASHAARLVGELGVAEVVVVTSWWHCRRAALLFRRSLRGTPASVHRSGRPPGRRSFSCGKRLRSRCCPCSSGAPASVGRRGG